MKRTFLAIAFVATTSISYSAIAANTQRTEITATEDDNAKTQVEPAALPDAVKATLAGDAYKDWKVASAWAVKADPVYYTIELKKDDKTNTINIGADGKVK